MNTTTISGATCRSKNKTGFTFHTIEFQPSISKLSTTPIKLSATKHKSALRVLERSYDFCAINKLINYCPRNNNCISCISSQSFTIDSKNIYNANLVNCFKSVQKICRKLRGTCPSRFKVKYIYIFNCTLFVASGMEISW